jgi:TPR repeat protein
MAYLWGEGVAKDIPAGARWLRMAATEGHGLSQAYLGMMFVYGHGVEENTERAMYWLRQSAAQDNTLGLRELGFLLDGGKDVPRNREEAMHLLAKAASLGDEKAQKWIDTNCPDKPDWLKALRQSPEDDAQN